jgi:hypothetical protein
MLRTTSVIWSVIVIIAAAMPAAAQPPASRPRDRDLRHQIYVMEGALARAVLFGAQQVNREIRSVSPDLISIAGDAQARGVYLDGYGVYFDVGVPILRQSMVWSLRQMAEPDDRSYRLAIESMRAQLRNERDPAKRHDVENAIARLELQLTPSNPFLAGAPAQRAAASQPAGSVGPSIVAPTESAKGAATPPSTQAGAAPPPAPAPQTVPSPSQAPASQAASDRTVLKDPNRAYTESVQRALIDAMIDYAAPMLIGDEEWLTVGARDNEPRDTFAPQDPYEEVVTVLLRIKGADLAAYRSGKIDRDEAKRRVEVREF